jgi:starch synthase
MNCEHRTDAAEHRIAGEHGLVLIVTPAEASTAQLFREPLDLPLAAVVSRLTHQKGIDLIVQAIAELGKIPVQVAIVGAGDRELVEQLRAAQRQFPETLGLFIGFDEQAAHLVEAGGDMFLMPSRFEPCGLNQMYSLRYGTLPIVRATGGLDDTVVDADAEPTLGTGFKFRQYTAEALVDALERALAAYKNTRRWKTIQRRAMAEDHSWDVSAREYVKVYEGAKENTDGIRKSADTDRRQLRPDGRRRNTRTR